MISHNRAQVLASARLDGPLAPDDARELQLHLLGCAACRSFAEQAEGLGRGLRALPHLPPSPNVSRQVREAIAGGRSPWPRLLSGGVRLASSPALAAVGSLVLVAALALTVVLAINPLGGDGDVTRVPGPVGDQAVVFETATAGAAVPATATAIPTEGAAPTVAPTATPRPDRANRAALGATGEPAAPTPAVPTPTAAPPTPTRRPNVTVTATPTRSTGAVSAEEPPTSTAGLPTPAEEAPGAPAIAPQAASARTAPTPAAPVLDAAASPVAAEPSPSPTPEPTLPAAPTAVMTMREPTVAPSPTDVPAQPPAAIEPGTGPATGLATPVGPSLVVEAGGAAAADDADRPPAEDARDIAAPSARRGEAASTAEAGIGPAGRASVASEADPDPPIRRAGERIRVRVEDELPGIGPSGPVVGPTIAAPADEDEAENARNDRRETPEPVVREGERDRARIRDRDGERDRDDAEPEATATGRSKGAEDKVRIVVRGPAPVADGDAVAAGDGSTAA